MKTEYELLSAEVRSALQSLVLTEVSLSIEDYTKWEMQVTELRRRINSAQVEGGLSGDQYEALLQGLRELRTELEFFHNKGKRKRSAGSV